jgi:hypothetical protein
MGNSVGDQPAVKVRKAAACQVEMRSEPKGKKKYADTVKKKLFSHVFSRSSPFLNSAASWPGLNAMRRALPESSSREETETQKRCEG